MEIKIRQNINGKYLPIILAVLSVICAFLGGLVGDILVALSGAILALVFLVDGTKIRLWFVLSSAAIIATNVAIDIYFGALVSVYSLEVIAIALIIALCFKLGVSKAVTAGILTVALSLFILLGLYLSGAASAGSFLLEDVIRFYSEYAAKLQEMLEAELAAIMERYSEQLGASGMTEVDYVSTLVLSLKRSLLSVLIVISFALSGIALKMFSLVCVSVSEDTKPILRWRFITSNTFAYFYIAVFFLGAFLSASDDALALTVATLNTVLMFVYAYIGFGVCRAMLRRRFSGIMSFIVLILAMLLLSSLAVQVLSILGVFTVINVNKAAKGNGESK